MVIRLLILCLLPLGVFGQMVDTRQPLDLNSWIHFDPEFLRVNHIDSLEIRLQTKRDGRPMRDWNDVVRLGFDASGNLRELFQTKAAGPITDTIHWLYEFDADQRWVRKQEKDRSGYYILEPEWNAQGEMSAMHFFKAPAPAKLVTDPTTARTAINSETYTYQYRGMETVRKGLNNYGLPYEQVTTSRDSLGYVQSVKNEFLVTRRVKERTHTYNEQGRLETVTFTQSHRSNVEQHRYDYDRAGNLTQVELHQDGALVETYEVVYDGLGRIDGIIVVDASDHSMKILNFSYP